jgi:hypothetical protein
MTQDYNPRIGQIISGDFMYVNDLKKDAVNSMRKEALKLRQDYLDYAEDMRLFADPDFWKAVEQVESGKGRKLSRAGLKKEIGL